MDLSEKYAITSRLGDHRKRKFGELFAGIARSTNDPVVIKAIRKNEHSKIARKRLLHEAEFSFNFTGLPNVLDLFESEQEIILVRTHVEGEPICAITDNLKRKQRLSFVLRFLDIYKAIDNKLRTEQIVHADIKPGNIIIDNHESNLSVNLIDFGMAIRTNQHEERSILFPLGYAAPELLLNHLDIVDHRTDQFSLGITLWRIFCGSIPLTHPNPSITTNLQLTHPLPDHAELPKGVYPILKKMCSKHQFKIPPNKMNPDDVKQKLIEGMDMRYANLDEVVDAFKSLPMRKLFYQKRSLR